MRASVFFGVLRIGLGFEAVAILLMFWSAVIKIHATDECRGLYLR